MKRALLLVGILLCSGAAIAKETPAGGGGSVIQVNKGVTQTGNGTAADPFIMSVTTPGAGEIGYATEGGKIGCLANGSGGGGISNLIVTEADNDGGTGVAWSGNTTDAIGETARSTTNGADNTDAIVAQVNGGNTANKAAIICDNLTEGGKTDWYLPAKDELKCLMDNKDTIGGFLMHNKDTIGGFLAPSGYWSSTESNANSAWSQFGATGKKVGLSVRCVRAFTPSA